MSSSISRFLGRAYQQSYLILFGHILNAPWKPREERRKQRYTATRKAALKYLKRYKKRIKSFIPDHVDKPTELEKAFSIWFQGENNAPQIVKACFRSMRKHLKQELIVLDENTLLDWISLPEYVVHKWKAGKIRPAHFSDICRVELLYQHGGVWLDATDYVTAPIPDIIMDSDFFMFRSGEKIRGSYSFVQNCFIRARKGDPLLGIWRHAILEYWKDENSVINYFTHQLLFRLITETNTEAARLFKEMPQMIQDPTHALWGEHCNDNYNEKDFKKLTEGAFFQKTNYKDKRLNPLKSGSIAEYIINS